MKRCARNSLSRVVAVIAVLAVALWGCAGGRAMRAESAGPRNPTDALRRVLDRWERWSSLTARVTFTLAVGDTTVSARGHMIYLLGERYEIGFVRPFDRILGTLYVTPERLIHWGASSKPQSFAAEDTVRLAELIPMRLPNWDPRDLLPLPVSGRTGGFRLDSTWTEEDALRVSGSAVGVAHVLTLRGSAGDVVSEIVRRDGRDPVMKTYRRIRSMNGWPIATRVVCADTTGTVMLTWTLKGLLLEAGSPPPPSADTLSHPTETVP